LYGFATPVVVVVVVVVVAVPAAVISTNSISHNASDPSAVRPRSVEVVKTFVTFNALGARQATVVENTIGPIQLEVPSGPQSACT
jgi:hypothetical protein